MAPVIDLNALRRKANPSFIATKPSKRKFGVDYLPPMTASLLNMAPPRHPLKTAQLLAKAETVLPESFNWADPVDVATKRMSASAADAPKVAQILKPLNQLGCGSCWAFATSSTLADRYTLFQGLKQGLNLSPTYLLACNTNPNDGCNGGLVSEAGNFFETTGIPSASCQDYGWCPTNGEVDNTEIPPCSEIGQSCYQDMSDGTVNPTDAIKTFYKAVPGSTEALPTPESIKAELWHNGPVTATFHIFADFVGRDPSMTNKPGWTNTSNIYINLTDPNEAMPSGDGLYSGYSPTDLLGGHAVVITGWGVEKNPQGLPAPVKAGLPNGQLEYWIVRNSWADWNDKGYFKIAVSVPELNINMTTLLDRSETQQGQMFGGGTTFLPVVNQSTPQVFTSPPGNNGGGSKPAPSNGGGGNKPAPSNGGGGNKPAPSNGGGGNKPAPSNGGGGNKPAPAPSNGGGMKGSSSPSNGGGSSSDNFWTQPGGIATIVAISVAAIAIIVTVVLVVKHKKKRRLGLAQ